MYTKAPIRDIKRIAKNKKGEPLNAIIIELANGKPSIYRKLSQFIRDLDNSGRLSGVDLDFLTSVNHPAIVDACTALEEGVVKGEFEYVKEGQEYEIQENASILNPNSSLYDETASVGDKAVYKSDGTYVTEGFLKLVPSMQTKMIETQSLKMAQLMMSQLGGGFNQAVASSNGNDDVEVDEEALAFAEAVGTTEPSATDAKQ